MSSQFTHMKIARKLVEKLGIDEGKEEFILGSVAPDSTYFSDDYLGKKVHSHLFENCGPWGDTQDYENWIANISNFGNKYLLNEKDTRKKMFLLGIIVHCLTDYWNDLLIWRALQKKMIPPMTYDGFKEAYYPESFRVDRWLYQNSDDAAEIMKLLHDSMDMGFEDFVNEDNIKDIKNHLINEQYNLPDPFDVSNHIYYTSDMILWFVEEVSDRVYKQLRDFRFISD